MIVPRFNFLTEDFVICGYQVTKIFRSGHDCTSTSSARSPRLPEPLLLATPLVIHEKNWQCLDPQAQVFLWLCRTAFTDQILSEILKPVQQVTPYL